MANDKTIDSFLGKIAYRNLRNYAVGQQMFCRFCGELLDGRRTVLVGDITTCLDCFNAALPALRRQVTSDPEIIHPNFDHPVHLSEIKEKEIIPAKKPVPVEPIPTHIDDIKPSIKYFSSNRLTHEAPYITDGFIAFVRSVLPKKKETQLLDRHLKGQKFQDITDWSHLPVPVALDRSFSLLSFAHINTSPIIKDKYSNNRPSGLCALYTDSDGNKIYLDAGKVAFFRSCFASTAFFSQGDGKPVVGVSRTPDQTIQGIISQMRPPRGEAQ